MFNKRLYEKEKKKQGHSRDANGALVATTQFNMKTSLNFNVKAIVEKKENFTFGKIASISDRVCKFDFT